MELVQIYLDLATLKFKKRALNSASHELFPFTRYVQSYVISEKYRSSCLLDQIEVDFSHIRILKSALMHSEALERIKQISIKLSKFESDL